LAQTLELERNTIKSKLNTLKKMEDNFEWYRDGVKAIMKAPSTDGPAIGQTLSAKILGLMADIIEAKPTYETAVEAVLGDALQYIIVKDQQAGLNAIDYLQSHKAGRSGFIPVSSVKQVQKVQPGKSTDARLLLNQITIKSGYETIVQALLGHVVFAENLPEAVELFNRNGSSNTIVTKNGDVISPQGILVGGSKDKLNGILVKKQELRNLGRKNTQLDQKLEKARLDQNTLESGARNLERQLQKLTEEKNNTIKNEIEAEKELVKAGEALKNANRHLEIVALEKEQLQGEASDIDEEMTQYNTALADISAEVKGAQNNVTDISATLRTVSAEHDKYNQKVVDSQLQLTALNAKLENSTNSLRRLKEFHDDSLYRLEHLAQEIHEKQQRQATAKQKISDYEQRLSQMYRDMESLDQSLKTNEENYQAIDAQLKDSDDKISAIKGKREKALEKFRLLELEQSERKIKQENIAGRLEEKYQNSFSDLKTEKKWKRN
jgi:chromosome segregation protein